MIYLYMWYKCIKGVNGMHGRSRGPERKQGGAAVQNFGKGNSTLKPLFIALIWLLSQKEN